MRLNRGLIVLLLVTCVTSACDQRAPTVARTEQGILTVTTGRGVSLDVIEWGGSGTTLVFLAGGGASSPYIFDDLAPRLVGHFRAIGITRRGSGGSSDIAPRRFDDLVDDIVAVLDALEVPSAILVGHSFAGLEMARFGEKYSDRCDGLVYLDAAYDYTDPAFDRIMEATPPPQAPPMQSEDSASIDAMNGWYERTHGYRVPIRAIKASRRFDGNGRLVGSVTPNSAQWQIDDRAPRWGNVACPSLGIYAVPTPPATSLRYWDELDASERDQAVSWYRPYANWTAIARATFRSVYGNQVVEFPGSSHYFFLERPDETARMILDFVSRVQE